jgi:hypothetical protein
VGHVLQSSTVAHDEIPLVPDCTDVRGGVIRDDVEDLSSKAVARHEAAA